MWEAVINVLFQDCRTLSFLSILVLSALKNKKDVTHETFPWIFSFLSSSMNLFSNSLLGLALSTLVGLCLSPSNPSRVLLVALIPLVLSLGIGHWPASHSLSHSTCPWTWKGDSVLTGVSYDSSHGQWKEKMVPRTVLAYMLAMPGDWWWKRVYELSQEWLAINSLWRFWHPMTDWSGMRRL